MRQIILLYTILALIGCKKSPNQDKLDTLVDRGNFRTSQLKSTLKDAIQDTNYMKAFRFGDTLATFYKDNKYKPIWALYMVNDSMANLVVERLNNARSEGLDPSYYHVKDIQFLRHLLDSGHRDDLYDELVHLELMVSDNMLSFAHDRRLGRTHPKILFGDNYMLPLANYKEFGLFDVLDYEHFRDVLDSTELKDTAYQKLKGMLANYYHRMDTGETWVTFDTTGIRKIQIGDATTLLPTIARKLLQLGLITDREAAKANPSTYTMAFLPYIKRFQASLNLYDDGVIGWRTLGMLNETMQDRIDQIIANMERIRWFQAPENLPYILVNLPAYELGLYQEDSIEFMRICIGQALPYDYATRVAQAKAENKLYKIPPNHQTPQIFSKVAYMVINPTWNVPHSIVRREMWYKMKSNPHYLDSLGYGVFYKKKEIRSDTINWKLYDPRRLPFEIIQKAGDKNALGKVKFIFPNKFSIYLHDTPLKKKFEQSNRAVSHGCVRVANPISLGAFLTQHIDTLDADDFRIHMGLEPLDSARLESYDPEDSTARIQPLHDTKLIRLNKQMPLYFDYRTIYFDTTWTPHYKYDVYNRNSVIIKAMTDQTLKTWRRPHDQN